MKQRLTIYLDDPVLMHIEKLARNDGRTVNGWISHQISKIAPPKESAEVHYEKIRWPGTDFSPIRMEDVE